MRKVVATGANAAAVALFISGSAATTSLANPGDQYILPIHSFEQQNNFDEIPNAGADGISSAWRHVTNPGQGGGGDLARIYWRVNIPGMTTEDGPRFYAVEWWDPTAGSDSNFHVVESIYEPSGSNPNNVNPNHPWAGQFGTNLQWMKTTASVPGGGLWRQAGGGPQAPATANYYDEPGGNPPASFMWLQQDSKLFVKWDFAFGTIDRTYAEMRITEVPLAPVTVYWDTNGLAGGSGAPSATWATGAPIVLSPTSRAPNFNSDQTGGINGFMRGMTTAVDTVVFQDAGTYTVDVSQKRYAAQMNVTAGDVTFNNGKLAIGTFDVSAGATATVNSTLSGLSGSVAKSGAGTLQAPKLPQGIAVSITGGTMRVLESSPGLGTGHPAGNNASVSRPASLSVSPGATLDITNNDVILDYTGSSPVAAYEALVASGYNVTGDWNGDGITSSVAALDGNYVVAIADNATLAAPFGTAQGGALFAGVDVDLTTVLIKFTHRADINLDGVITPDDSAIFGGNYDENQPAVWATGDMNYDGTFTPDDAAIFGGAYDESLASLPEPGGLTLLALAGIGISRRRRRRRRDDCG